MLLLSFIWVWSLSGKSERPQLLQGSGTLSLGKWLFKTPLLLSFVLLLFFWFDCCFPTVWSRISGSFFVSSMVFLILFFNFMCLKEFGQKKWIATFDEISFHLVFLIRFLVLIILFAMYKCEKLVIMHQFFRIYVLWRTIIRLIINSYIPLISIVLRDAPR